MKIEVSVTKKRRLLKQGDIVENKHTGDIGLVVVGTESATDVEYGLNLVMLTPNNFFTNEDLPRLHFPNTLPNTNSCWEDWELVIPRENVEFTIKQGE